MASRKGAPTSVNATYPLDTLPRVPSQLAPPSPWGWAILPRHGSSFPI